MLTEKNYPAEFILSEAPGKRSRSVAQVPASQIIKAGMLVAVLLTGASAGAAVAAAGNTGNGAFGAVTASAHAQAGNYSVVFIEPVTNLGTFQVVRPDGTVDGTGKVGTAYAGDIGFTIADGATDFVAGDLFTVPVTATGKQIKPWNATASDGTQIVGGIAYADTVTAAGETAEAVYLDCDAEVNGNLLVYSATDAATVAAGDAGLAAKGIKVRR